MTGFSLRCSDVSFGSEMPQTASDAGRQKYPRAHGPDRASNGLLQEGGLIGRSCVACSTSSTQLRRVAFA
jgi:hypothetical protein